MNRIKAVLQKCWQYEIVHAAVYSALLNMLVECFNRRSLIGLVMIFTNPVLFLYNTLIILVTMSVVLLFHRKVFVYCTVSVVWLLLAITNFVVLCSRKTPFTAMDIYLIEDAIKVIPVYLNAFPHLPGDSPDLIIYVREHRGKIVKHPALQHFLYKFSDFVNDRSHEL